MPNLCLNKSNIIVTLTPISGGFVLADTIRSRYENARDQVGNAFPDTGADLDHQAGPAFHETRADQNHV